ncbi:MAG: HAMP domain-containing histidine kinase [Clostridiales bacterium]|nr:HAMP domain-containing histidine kinase [Clostridiales bacterium]
MRILKTIWSNLSILVMFLVFDAFFIFALWVIDSEAIVKLGLSVFLFSVIAFSSICALLARRDRKAREALGALLDDPDQHKKEQLIRYLGPSSRESVDLLYKRIIDDEQQISSLSSSVADYEDYVEEWAHEAKTPISLLTLILDNHGHEMPADVVGKTEYIRSRLSEYVDQMLQYSRVKSSRKDYLFDHIKINDVISEVVEDYRPLLDEKDFTVLNFVKDEICYCDRRALKFMLGQFVSNAVKYSKEDPSLKFTFEDGVLTVADNGIGVKESDLPYIFERGFTGDTGEFRGKATGMGLYLASRVAEDMNLSLNASGSRGGGFSISVIFPDIKKGL